MIRNLLEIKDGKVSAAMSPMETAKLIAEEFKGRLIGLNRISFPGKFYYQENDGGYELTCYDHLMITLKFASTVLHVVTVDMGVKSVNICMYEVAGKELTMNTELKEKWIRKLDESWWKIYFEDFACKAETLETKVKTAS